MTVERICQREVETIAPEDSVQTAARKMRRRRVGTLVVLDAARRPLGILTDRDIVARAIALGKPLPEVRVAEIMTRPVTVVPEQAPIEEAVARMRLGRIRRVPVVDAAGRLCGIVTLDDVLALLAEEFAEIGRLLDRSVPRGAPTRSAKRAGAAALRSGIAPRSRERVSER